MEIHDSVCGYWTHLCAFFAICGTCKHAPERKILFLSRGKSSNRIVDIWRTLVRSTSNFCSRKYDEYFCMQINYFSREARSESRGISMLVAAVIRRVSKSNNISGKNNTWRVSKSCQSFTDSYEILNGLNIKRISKPLTPKVTGVEEYSSDIEPTLFYRYIILKIRLCTNDHTL